MVTQVLLGARGGRFSNSRYQVVWSIKNDKKEKAVKRITALVIGIFLITGVTSVWAADYPNRPIKFIVPWSAGGSSDAMSRALSAVAKDHLGVELNIVNRTGAGGTIAATEMKGTKPDGYTIQLNAVGVMTTQPVLRDVAYSIDDFDYVTGLSFEPIVVAVNTSSKYQSFKDLQEADKTIMIAGNAVGSLPYIGALSVMSQLDIKAEAVPMKGGGPSIAALLGNQVEVGSFHPNEAVQHVENGDLKFLCILQPERSADFPDVPSCFEVGAKSDYSVWKWIQTPKGVDPEIIAFLAEKFNAMKADPKFQEFAKNSKLTLIDIDGKEVEKRLRSQAAATSAAIHDIGIK